MLPQYPCFRMNKTLQPDLYPLELIFGDYHIGRYLINNQVLWISTV